MSSQNVFETLRLPDDANWKRWGNEWTEALTPVEATISRMKIWIDDPVNESEPMAIRNVVNDLVIAFGLRLLSSPDLLTLCDSSAGRPFIHLLIESGDVGLVEWSLTINPYLVTVADVSNGKTSLTITSECSDPVRSKNMLEALTKDYSCEKFQFYPSLTDADKELSIIPHKQYAAPLAIPPYVWMSDGDLVSYTQIKHTYNIMD